MDKENPRQIFKNQAIATFMENKEIKENHSAIQFSCLEYNLYRQIMWPLRIASTPDPDVTVERRWSGEAKKKVAWESVILLWY